jgi:hypothetical protein
MQQGVGAKICCRDKRLSQSSTCAVIDRSALTIDIGYCLRIALYVWSVVCDNRFALASSNPNEYVRIHIPISKSKKNQTLPK